MRKLVYVENDFRRFFEGLYIPNILECKPHPSAPKYEGLGLTKLVWREDSKTLTVHLQNPGLLIGERGKTIDALKEYMDCNIEIVEVKSLIEEYTLEPKTVRLTEILDWLEQKTSDLSEEMENSLDDFDYVKFSGQNDLLTEILGKIKKKFNF